MGLDDFNINVSFFGAPPVLRVAPVESAGIKPPEPEIKPDPVKDTFTRSEVAQLHPPDDNNSSQFSFFSPNIPIFVFDPDAFKNNLNIDSAWVNATSNIKFTNFYIIDGFNAKNPNQLTFEEMKSASTELNARLEFLNDSQRRTLSALTQDISNIETIALNNNTAPEQVLQDLLEEEREKYSDYFKFIDAAKEQVTAGEVAEFVGNKDETGIRGSLVTNIENETIKEFRKLSIKLKEDQYNSPQEKAEDLITLVRLQSKIEQSVDFSSAEAARIRTDVKDTLVKQMEENKELIKASLEGLTAAYDQRIQELRGKQDLSLGERETLERYENNREEVLELVEKAKNSGFDKFAESYSELIMEIQETDPKRAQELITGMLNGNVAPEVFAESFKNTGNTEDKEAATQILHDIYTDKVLAERLKVSSKDKDSQIRRNGGLDSWAEDLNLSQPTVINLKSEMRELYRDNPSEYNYYYNSGNNYYNQEASASSGYTKAEILSLLSPLDQKIANGGQLSSVVSFDAAVNTLMKQKGIPETVAKLMLLDDIEGLRQYMKETSNLAPKYLELAQLSNLNNT